MKHKLFILMILIVSQAFSQDKSVSIMFGPAIAGNYGDSYAAGGEIQFDATRFFSVGLVFTSIQKQSLPDNLYHFQRTTFNGQDELEETARIGQTDNLVLSLHSFRLFVYVNTLRLLGYPENGSWCLRLGAGLGLSQGLQVSYHYGNDRMESMHFQSSSDFNVRPKLILTYGKDKFMVGLHAGFDGVTATEDWAYTMISFGVIW